LYIFHSSVALLLQHTIFKYISTSLLAVPKIKVPENKEGKIIKYTFREGLQLHCYMIEEGIPRASLAWERCICDVSCSKCTQWSKLQNATRVRTVGHQSTLTIQSQTSEEVNYRCEAKNIAGNDERMWTIVRIGVRG
jgi:hypothetical protein